MKPEAPKRIDIQEDELRGILKSIESLLPPSQYNILSSAVNMLIWLQSSVKDKSITIARLGRMLFGKQTESSKNLKKRINKKNHSPNRTSEEGNAINPQEESKFSKGSSEGESESEDQSASSSDNKNDKSSSESLADGNNGSEKVSSPKKGHGKKPLIDYKVSKIIHIPHDKLKAGEVCRICKVGKLYHVDPQVLLVIKGQPPIKAEAYSAQGLRCNACGEVFRAAFPKEVMSKSRADITAKAIVSIAKYKSGTPLYRLEALQSILNVPISDSEMWEWTESTALALFPVHQAFLKIASDSEVIHNDDTKGKILDLIKENELAQNDKNHRKGMYTSVILSKVEKKKIALYFTGRKNSGENLDDVLDHRQSNKKKPIQACDASSQNRAERHETDMAKCLNHARHNFCDLTESWPKEAMIIIEMINKVFHFDRETKQMNEGERLAHHQKHSAPIMEKLKMYSQELIKEKIVEPNSGFGKAVNYLFRHWEGLTLFLKNGQAPLSNNDGERLVKSYVLIRKNSYFYKSCWGAFVGDTILSAIETCTLNSVNPYEYLVAIQANEEAVKKNPESWLPWNFLENSHALDQLQAFPEEEVYQINPAGVPLATPVLPQSVHSKEKKTIREIAKDFFKSIWGIKWNPAPA